MTININRPADILEASCQCGAGKDYEGKKLYESCTQRLRQWYQPTRKSSNPTSLLDINFISMNHDKTEEEKPKYLQFLQTDIHVPEATTALRQLLIKYNQQTIAAASLILPKQAAVARIPLPSRVITQISSLLPPQDLTLDMLKYYMDHIYLLVNQIAALEEITKGQASSVDWHEARRCRISSVNMHIASFLLKYSSIKSYMIGTSVHSNSVRAQDFHNLAKTMLQQQDNNLYSNLAVRHGVLNEELCRRRYVTEQAKNDICSTTYPCGLVVDPTAPYLCCSPDAIVMGKSNDKISFSILECKCVYTEPGATWDDVIFTRENFCLERHAGRLRLRHGHAYHYQLITLTLPILCMDIFVHMSKKVNISWLRRHLMNISF